MNAKQHEKFLRRFGASRQQIQKAKKRLGSPICFPDYKIESRTPMSNSIPDNGLKSVDMSKAEFCKKNYAMVPAYNKGPIMVCSKEDMKHAGKK